MPTTETVQIPIEILDKATANARKVGNALEDVGRSSERSSKGLASARMAWTELNSAIGVATTVINIASRVMQATYGEYAKYAEQVRNLSLVSGQSAEETSRFIQVLDDYKISADDAMTATRTLTQQGYAPSIQTLAKLSDQYLKLNTAEEKNKFVIDNLGRSGLQWVEVLNKGSEALLKQGAAVDKNLILSQKQLDDTRKLELAWDSFGDELDGFNNLLGAELAPILTEFVNSWIWATRVAGIYFDAIENGTAGQLDLFDVLRDTAQEVARESDALLENAKASEKNTEATLENAEAQEKAAEETSKRLSGLIGLINQMQGAEEDYTEKSKDLAKERADAEHELIELWADADEARRKGQPVGEDLQENINNAIIKLDELKAKEAELAEERQTQHLQFMSNLLAEELARDGWTQEEFDAFAEQQQAWGLWSADVVEEAKAAWQEVEKIRDHIEGIPSSKTITITTVEQAVRMTQSQTLGGYAYGTAQYNRIAHPGRDSGGYGVAGQPYVINPIAAPEVFIPSSSGTFVPNADKKGLLQTGGTEYNITIYNPVAQAAEASVQSALKKMSYLGRAG